MEKELEDIILKHLYFTLVDDGSDVDSMEIDDNFTKDEKRTLFLCYNSIKGKREYERKKARWNH